MSRFASIREPGARRRLFVGALVALAIVPSTVSAQPPLELSWRAPAECPQRAALLEQIRKLLGTSSIKAGTVHANGEIQKDDDGFELRLRIEDDSAGGERRLHAPQCAELGGAAAVALALLLNDEADDDATDVEVTPLDGAKDGRAGTSEEKSAPDAGKLETPVRPLDEDPPPSEEAAPRAWQLLLTAPLAVGGLGPLPQPTWGAGLGLGIESAGWSLRALGQWSAEQNVTAEVTGYGAQARRLSAGLWACRELAGGRWSLAPCLEVTVAHLHATGYGPYLRRQSQSEAWVGLGAGAIGRIRVFSWLAAMVGASAQVELSRPRIVLDGVGPVRQLRPATATLWVGPEWIF